MRIRQTKYQRRIMCLLVICLWSLASLIWLWKQIAKDYKVAVANNFENKLKYILKNRRVHPKQIKYSEEESLSGNYINDGPTAKFRSPNKPSIDYGRNRDLDVEGVQDYIMWYENFQNVDRQLPTLPRQQRCKKPMQNIAFLKTHFTGSDVITNILNRYGDLNNLNIALPSDGLSTFYWPMRFQWKYIDITLLNGSLPNIISNHARYNNDVMDNILNPGSVYITILRDPVRQLETTFNNLGFGGLLQVTNTSDQLKTFLEDPKYYIRGVIRRKEFKDTLNLIKNAQFFDLGLPTTDYHRRNIIKTTIQELYEKFTIVLIYEYLDESLLLMKRKFCWQLDDILYLKFHYTSNNVWNRSNVSDELGNKIYQWNEADFTLYKFFNKTLWEEIMYEGENFWKELKQFKSKLKDINLDCLASNQNNDNYYVPNKYDDRFNLEEIPVEKPNVNIFKDDTALPPVKKNNNNKQLSYSGLKTTKIKHDIFKNKTLKDLLVYSNAIKNFSNTSDKSTALNQDNVAIIKEEFESNITETNSNSEGGSGGHLLSTMKKVKKLKRLTNLYGEEDGKTKTDKLLNEKASPWNYHFCKKLLMSESEYLNYFRRKHAYAKAAAKRLG